MLFTYPALDDAEKRVERATTGIRAALRRYIAAEPPCWADLLARMTRARALAASASVAGVHVSDEDAIAAIDREEPADTDRDAWRAVVGYRQAMEYIFQRHRNPSFTITEDMLMAVHFMICQSDREANPGRYTPGWVCVRNTSTGDVTYEGVDRDRLEPLMRELLDYANEGQGESVLLRAAMTHLNLVLLHPFTDGNGRTARCMHTAVLARDGMAAPAFSSIEAYIGRNRQTYYDVLAEVGGSGWRPERDAKPWVRFCLRAHYRQAQTLLRRTREMERVHAELAELVETCGFPDRTVLALLQAAFGIGVRNASYRASADVSQSIVSRELGALVDAKLLIPEGNRRSRSYSASPMVAEIRQRLRLPDEEDDPFAEDGRGGAAGDLQDRLCD